MNLDDFIKNSSASDLAKFAFGVCLGKRTRYGYEHVAQYARDNWYTVSPIIYFILFSEAAAEGKLNQAKDEFERGWGNLCALSHDLRHANLPEVLETSNDKTIRRKRIIRICFIALIILFAIALTIYLTA